VLEDTLLFRGYMTPALLLRWLMSRAVLSRFLARILCVELVRTVRLH